MKPRVLLASVFALSSACVSSPLPVSSESPIKNGPPSDVCRADDPRESAVTVDVLPEAGDVPLTRVIDSANSHLRVLMYMMGADRDVLTHLVAKAKAGVAVKVILDISKQAFNQKAADLLTTAGAEVIFSDPAFSYMHAKVIVADDREAAISTGNAIKELESERNLVAHVTDHDDIATLLTVFDADFNRQTPDVSCTRLLISPINSKPRLLTLIQSAKKSIVIESMQLSESDLVDAIDARKKAGVDVRIILSDPAWFPANVEAGAALKARELDPKFLVSPTVHVKSIIVDGETAYLGSENLSMTSLTKNREVGLLVGDLPAIDAMQKSFEHDWILATPF